MSEINTPEDLRRYLNKTHKRCKMIRFLEFYNEPKPTIVIICYFSKWDLFLNSSYKLLRPIKYDIREHLPDDIKFELIACAL